jgi:hypothetical protein
MPFVVVVCGECDVGSESVCAKSCEELVVYSPKDSADVEVDLNGDDLCVGAVPRMSMGVLRWVRMGPSRVANIAYACSSAIKMTQEVWLMVVFLFGGR